MEAATKTFKVEENGKSINIEYYVFSPEGAKTLAVATAFTGHTEHYLNLIEPLSENFRIVSYHYRGHGESEGSFSFENSVMDLEHLIEEEKGKVGLVGHSSGASVAAATAKRNPDKVSGIYLINPYLGAEYLPKKAKLFVHAAYYFPEIVNFFINNIPGLKEKGGFHSYNPALIYGQLAVINPEILKSYVPLGFALSDADEVLGTRGNPSRYRKIEEKLKVLSPDVTDFSNSVRGLNHCLNAQKGHYVPFLSGKNMEAIIPIENFFRNLY